MSCCGCLAVVVINGSVCLPQGFSSVGNLLSGCRGLSAAAVSVRPVWHSTALCVREGGSSIGTEMLTSLLHSTHTKWRSNCLELSGSPCHWCIYFLWTVGHAICLKV